MFNKYTNGKGHTVLANDKVYNLFYKDKGYYPKTGEKGKDPALSGANPHTEHTRAWYMHELDTKGIEYRQNDRLDTLKELYTEEV